jgi:hypothetical protein
VAAIERVFDGRQDLIERFRSGGDAAMSGSGMQMEDAEIKKPGKARSSYCAFRRQ